MKLKIKRGFQQGTRINSIEVPEELRSRRLSGIGWFDSALGGEGFVPSTTMMLTGAPGCGKSTLVRQLADSMTKEGHVVVLNSGEENLYQVKMACERMGLTQDFMVGEETMVKNLLEFMDVVKEAANGKQVVLLQDSLQTLDDGMYPNGATNAATSVRCTEMLVDWAKENYGIVVFVGQCTKGGDFAGKNTIRHAVDSHAQLYVDTTRKSETYGCLLFEIPKHRWGSSNRTFIMEITSNGLDAKDGFTKSLDWQG
jgi:DNA repair protein RadA/Sms